MPEPIKNTGIPAASAPISNSSGEKESRISTEKSSSKQTAATTPSEEPKTTLLTERSATQLKLTNDQIGDALMEFNRAIKNILSQKTPHASILQMIETRFPKAAGALGDLQKALTTNSVHGKGLASNQLINVLTSALTDIMDARLRENANELPPGTTRKDLIDIALASPEIKPHYDEFIKQHTTINTSPKSFLDSLSNFLDKLAEFFKSPHA